MVDYFWENARKNWWKIPPKRGKKSVFEKLARVGIESRAKKKDLGRAIRVLRSNFLDIVHGETTRQQKRAKEKELARACACAPSKETSFFSRASSPWETNQRCLCSYWLGPAKLKELERPEKKEHGKCANPFV